MNGETGTLIFFLLTIGISGFFLKYYLQSNSSLINLSTPLAFITLGIVAASQLRDFTEAIGFLAAATAQFASFVFVSRLRQRGSFFWHTVASLASNGTWYITMHALDAARAYWWLYLIYVFGIVAGRVIGASWSQYIESLFNIKADSTRDPKLAPGQRLKFIAREKTFWVLISAILIYVGYGLLVFEKDMAHSLLIVIGLSLLQNFTYSLSSRASQRGNNWLMAGTGLLAGATFYVSVVYLFSKNMSLLLLIPYMLATTLGSTTGAFISMLIEYATKTRPDQHLKSDKKTITPWQEKAPYAFIMFLAVSWILFQKQIFDFFGRPISNLTFPLPISGVTDLPRYIVILSISLLFFFDEVLQTLMSRAGNRDHTGYHVVTCIPKGVVSFFKVSYIAMNAQMLDVIPVAIFSGCLGSLFGKDISEKIERWLQARMDPVRSSPDGSKSTV